MYYDYRHIDCTTKLVDVLVHRGNLDCAHVELCRISVMSYKTVLLNDIRDRYSDPIIFPDIVLNAYSEVTFKLIHDILMTSEHSYSAICLRIL